MFTTETDAAIYSKMMMFGKITSQNSDATKMQHKSKREILGDFQINALNITHDQQI